MLLEDDLRQLLKVRTESKNLDYKEAFNWATFSKDDKHEIVKDILAMANTLDGGKIVFGVQDSDFDPVGLKKEDFESFDTTKINDLLHNFTEPKHTCQVFKQQVDGKYFVIIDVPEFKEVPIVCKNDAFSKTGNPQRQILRRGQIYIRTEKASTEQILSADEMRELIGRAFVKKGDELLGYIERLIKGKALSPTDESDKKFDNEIKKAHTFFDEKIGNTIKQYGFWEVRSYPVDYNPKRLPDHKTIKVSINHSTVRKVFFSFPDESFAGNTSNFNEGVESFRDEFRIWGYRVYQSGLFIWRQAIEEDVDGYTDDGKKILSYARVVALTTVFYLFFKRFYEKVVPYGDLHIEILIHGTRGRKLVSLKKGPIPESLPPYIANVDFISFQDDVKVVELKASYKEIASRAIRKIFEMFNWNDITEEKISKEQDELLEGIN